jgi:TonB family protein
MITLFFGATILLIAAAVVDRLLVRASASTRHLVWTAALLGALLLPLTNGFAPAWPLPRVGGAAGEILARVEALQAPADSAIKPAAAAPAAPPRPGFPSLSTLWAVGFGLVLMRLAVALGTAYRLRRSSTPAVVDGTPVLLTSQSLMPMTIGLLRPSIVLPIESLEWGPARLHAVVQHELAHMRRHDLLWQLLTTLACAVYWPNPLVWLARRRTLQLREMAADDAVLRAGLDAQGYAESLLQIARSLAEPRLCEAATMARPRELEGRLLAILDGARNRRGFNKRACLVAVGATLLLVMTVAGLRPLAAQTTTDTLSVNAALDQLRAAERSDGPNSVAFGRALVTAGRAYADAGDEGTATSMFARAVEVLRVSAPPDASYSDALYYSAVLADKPGAKVFENVLAVARASGNRQVLARAAHILGVLTAHEDPIAAERFFKESLDNQTDPILVRNTATAYGRMLTEQGRVAEAAEMQQKGKQALDRIPAVAIDDSEPTIKRIGDGIQAPLIQKKQEPAYSAEARAAKLEGTVLLSIVVGADGLPRDVKVLRPAGLGLDQRAVQAVKEWVFKPARDSANQPVSVRANVEVNFRLL